MSAYAGRALKLATEYYSIAFGRGACISSTIPTIILGPCAVPAVPSVATWSFSALHTDAVTASVNCPRSTLGVAGV